MRSLLSVLFLLAAGVCAQARSGIYTFRGMEAEQRITAQNPGISLAPDIPGRKAARPSSYPAKAYHKPPGYDVTRENGAYFFDTVYKLRVPLAKHIQLGLNGGYTFYDKCLHGYGRGGGSLGLVGGVTLTLLRPPKAGSPIRKAFLRLNADVVSYPYRYKAGKDAYDISRYTRDLSARVYVDARVTRRALTLRCMAGYAAGAEGLPLFAGISVGYRFHD